MVIKMKHNELRYHFVLKYTGNILQTVILKYTLNLFISLFPLYVYMYVSCVDIARIT